MQKLHPPAWLDSFPTLYGKYAICLTLLFYAVLLPAQLSITLEMEPIQCLGANNAQVEAHVTGGLPPYHYLWSNDSQDTAIYNLFPGVYELTVTDASGDTATAMTEISPVSGLMIFITPSKPNCSTSSNGHLLAEAFGGTPPYSFSWNNGKQGAELNQLKVGDYTLTVTDSRGCQQESSIHLEPQSHLNVGALGTPASCLGLNDGFATASAQYGVQPYSYSWDNGGQSQVINDLGVGTYQVTVTDALGCVDTASALVQASLNLEVSGSALLCGPGPNSNMLVSASGGTTPYHFQWNTGEESSNMENLSEGEYTVTVTDSTGCKTVETFSIEAFDFSISVIPRDVLCFGDSTGSITVQASGGELPYSYNWSHGDTTDVVNDLPAGTYSVTVSDVNGCGLDEIVELKESPPILLSTALTDAKCNGDASGSATIIPSGGRPPYSYIWSNNQILDQIENVSAGIYTVTVSDANFCEEEISVEIKDPPALQVDISRLSIDCDSSNGALTATVSGGTGPYTYQWSTGDTLATTANLPAGIYQLTVVDAQSCTIEVKDIELESGFVFELSFDIQQIVCSDNPVGSVTAQVTGGAPPYQFSWSNGATSPSIEDLAAGSYKVIVTDGNGCQMEAEAIVSQTPAFSAEITGQNIACFGLTNGQAQAELSGGTAPFFYQWSTGASGTSIVNLAADTYHLTVTDSGGCSDTASIVIEEPPALMAVSMAIDISCSGEQDGSASVEVSGGVAPYTYSWGNGNTGPSINGLPAGSYGVIVEDANNCIAVASVNINEPPPLTLSLMIDQIPCEGNSDGVIHSSVEGGTPAYTYLWSNGDTTATIDSLQGGNYGLTLTDTAGCQTAADIFLEEKPALSLSLLGLDVLCSGQANGSINAEIDGGTSPFFYSWSTGSSNPSLLNLSPGTYHLSVTDIEGCTDTDSVLIQEPPRLTAIASSTDISCSGAGDGQASVMVSGGVEPYFYSWGNGATEPDIDELPAGSYGVIVEDANACIAVASVNISEPPPLEINLIVQKIPCEGTKEGRIKAIVEGGTPGYRYLWNTGDTLAMLSDLSAGDYQLEVTDSTGCQITAEINLEEKPGVAVSLFGKDIQCFGQANGEVQAAVEGGTSPFFYNWSNGETGPAIDQLSAGTYSLTLTDIEGCTDTNSISIIEPDSLRLSIIATDPKCFGEVNGTAEVMVEGGLMPYTYQWNNDSTTQRIDGLTSGLYEVLVKDANACQSTTQVTIVEPPALSVDLAIGETPCEGTATGVINAEAAGGSPEYAYAWNNGGSKSGISNLEEGLYILTLTDSHGCFLVDSLSLIANPQPACTINILSEIEDGADGALEARVSSGTAPFSFIWSNGDSTAVIDSLSFGDYTVTVSDANDCTTTCSDTLMGLATVGSFVWIDLNRDGIQDEDEPGFKEVRITITEVDSTGELFMAETYTDAFGFYQFEVPPGDYKLSFFPPEGYLITKANQGDDEEKDSDINPSTLMTEVIRLRPRQQMFHLDAGCITECDRLTQPGRIATSTNYLCGAGNDPGPILNVVSPSGGSGSMEYLWMRSSEDGPLSSGNWEPIPDSNTPTYDPGPLSETTYFVRCARREKCATYVESNIVKIEVGTEAVAKVIQPDQICEGDQVSFSAVSTGPDAQIDWTFTGSVFPAQGTGETIEVRYSYFGTFKGILNVQENGCTATREFPVNVTNNPILCGGELVLQTEILEEESQKVRLRWNMERSDADLRYQLEHSSDGAFFEVLDGFVEPIRQTGEQTQFQEDTRAPKRGRNYFRVKVSDSDGNSLYSEAREVIFLNQSALVLLFPNPVTDQINLEFFETFGESVRVELLSAQGHLLSTANLAEGEQQLQFFLGDFPNGIYFIRIFYGELPVKHLRIYKQ